MEKNEKYVLAALALVTVAQALKLHTFKRDVSKFTTATASWIDQHEQAGYDAMFGRIVDNYHPKD